MQSKSRCEILAPCGSPEVLTAALRTGCDAVYLGGEHFSARQNACNFSDLELEQAVRLCHRQNVKVYLAINTMIFDEQLDECISAVKHAAEIGVDALITQDLALVEIVKKCCPDLEIHSSTQMTIHTADGVEMSKRLGFSRAVLSRELPLDIIRPLSQLGIETEVFVHGALCMSVSGQCYMSAVIGSRSANRGLCAQACRLPCSAVRGRERYDLSLKDMSYLDSISDIAAAGVSSLKIEGRMKRPEYVAMSVNCCKKALAGEDYDKQTLADVFSRGGFTDGYLYRRTGREMFGTRQKEDVNASAKALPKIHELYRREFKRDTVSFKFTMQADKPCVLSASDGWSSCAQVCGEVPQIAQNKPTDSETVLKQLSKLGDTIYTLDKTEFELDEGLFISPAQINALRRQVCEKLDGIRADKNTNRVKFSSADILDFDTYEGGKSLKIRINVTNLSQLERVDFDDIELCGVPLDLAQKAAELYPADKLMAVMPRFTFDESSQREKLKAVRSAGITKMLAANIAHIKAAEELGFELHTDYGFNLANSCALNAVKKLGAKDAVVSFELKAAQISRLKKPLPIGIFAYGRLPLMLTVNCPVSQAVGCKSCTGYVTDRTNREFPVKCSKKQGYVEILNSEKLYLADKLDEFRGLDFITLNFTDESAGEVRKIISQYPLREKSKNDKITRGLYFRGVM